MQNEKLKLRGLTYDYKNRQGLHFLIERLQRRCPAYDCGHCITEYPKSKKIRLIKSALDAYFRIPKGNKLSSGQWHSFTKEASDLGTKIAIIMGDGEPTIHPDIDKIIDSHQSSGIETILFTKGYTLNKERAEFYRQTNTRLMVSVDTLDENLYKELTGSEFSISSILKKILMAKEIMYQGISADPSTVPIAFNTILSRKNMDELPNIQDFCNEQKIALYIIPPLMAGRLLDNAIWKKYVGATKKEQEELKKYTKELGASDPTCCIDEKGYCRQPTDALVIDEFGRMYPCVGTCPDAWFMPLGVYPKISIKEAVARRDEYVRHFSQGKSLKCIKHGMPKGILYQPASSNIFLREKYYERQGVWKGEFICNLLKLISKIKL